MHTHLCTGDHQRISHVVTGISEICQLPSLQITEFLTDRQKIRQHLGRMILIGQTVPYRHSCVFRQFFHDLLAEAAVLNTIVHPSKYTGCVCNALFLADLRTLGIQISHLNTEVMGCHLKRAARSRTGLLKNQCDIHSLMGFSHDPLLLLFFQICCQIQKISNLLRCKILQC